MRWIGQITYDEVAYFREDVIIEAGNKLGVGTTSPSELLHISSGVATHAKILIDAGADADLILDKGAGSRRSHIDYKIAGTTKWYAGTADSDVVGDGDDYFIGTTVGGSNAEFFLKRSNGNVGIGTTSPASLLHVEGAVQIGVNDAGHDFTLYGDTANYNMMWDASSSRLEFNDNTKAMFGNGIDLQIYHTGSHSNIKHDGTGDLIITQAADDQDIIFQCDDGSGGTTAYLTLDGGLGYITVQKRMQLQNSVGLYLGTSTGDLIYHNGSNTFWTHQVGDLTIESNQDDGDIIFKNDDGSGGTTAYLTLDGGSVQTKFYKSTEHQDDIIAGFGAGFDLQLYHNGTDSFVDNITGDLKIRNFADDKDIIFQSDDGSGGVATYFALDGGYPSPYTVFPDNSRLAFGAGLDLRINHDGSSSYIENYTGNLLIRNNQDDGDIILQSDDGSGGTTAYLTLDGSAGFTRSNKEFRMDDNVKFQAGTGGDLDIYHSGSHAVIDNATGNFTIQNSTDDGDIIFKSDDGSGGVATYLTLDGSAGHTTVQKEMNFGDNVEATFGASNDLKVYHSGSHSYMIQRGTGNLYIQQTTNDADITFTCDDGSGGNTPYLTLDGRNEEVVFYKPIVTAETQIKVLPHQFMSNEDGGVNKSSQFRDDTIIGVRSTADDSELYAFVEIPYGKTATNVTVYGNDASLAVNVYESDINAGALTDKTPGAGCVVGDVCDITDVAYSATNYLVIKVTTVSYTNDIVYGAVVTIT